jgi:hypothetical protein
MKKLYTGLRKTGVALFLIFIFNITTANAQFTTAGDIAFTGYLGGSTNEAFSFVLLKNIPAGATLNFTDRGWNGTAFNATTESLLTWTTGSALVAGREVTISGVANSTTMTAIISGSNINAGTVSGTMVSLPTSGDQVLAYIGTVAAPTFIAGIHMNSYNNTAGGADCGNTTAAAWDNATVNACVNPGNANSSAMPTGLTGGTNAVYVGVDNQFNTDFDNAKFNCTGALATPAQVRASVNNYSAGVNWTTINGDPAGLMTLPTGCAFLASIFPARLLNFSVRNMAPFITVNWQTANEQDMINYEVERSFDGRQFASIKTVAALRGPGTNNYVYNDAEALLSSFSTIYYRVKFHDVAGEFFYSNIKSVKVTNNGSLLVDNLPNPFSGTLQFNVVSKVAGIANMRITDMSGGTIMRVTRSLVAGDNRISLPITAALPAGIYTMEITMGNNDKKSFKLVKNPQ